MKLILSLVCTCALFCTAVMAADECCADAATAAEQRIREIDVKIALIKYEQIQTEKAKAEVQLVLVEAEDGDEDERKAQIKQLLKRIDYFSSAARETKDRILALAKPVSVAAK
jgi:hypothetical protein